MKKLLLVSLTFLMCFSLLAQTDFYYPYNHKFYKGITPKTSQKIALQTDSVFNKNGQLRDVHIFQNNTLGRRTYIEKNKGKTQTFFTYFRDTLYKMGVNFSKGDSAGIWQYDYNEQGKITRYFWAYKSIHKVRWSQFTFYDQQMRPVKYENRNRHNKLLGYTTIEYTDSGKLAERRYYNKKGKLKSVYSYACDAKGEHLKNVNSVNYCTSKGAHADGRFYEVLETIKNGKTRRQVYTYSNDSLLLSYELFDMKGKLNYKTLYGYNEQQMIASIDNYHRTSKKTSTTQYLYNAKGYVAELRYLNAKGKVTSSTRTSYLWH